MVGMDRNTMRAHVEMLVRALILGLSFTVVGRVDESLPPLSLTALRFTIAAIALLPLIWRVPDRLPSLLGFGIYGILGLCQAVFFGAMFWAAHRMSALSMTVLYVSVPFLAYCLGVGLRVEQSSGSLVGVLALGACGSLGMAWAESSRTSGIPVGLHFGAGETVFFVGCLGLALYSVLSRWALSRQWLSVRASVRTFWSVVVGAVLVGALALVEDKPQALATLKLSDILFLAYLGVLSTGGTFLLMQRAAAVLTPAAASAYSYAPPFVSMLLLFFTEPDSISWRWLPGAVLVVLAIALLQRRDVHPPSSIHATGVR